MLEALCYRHWLRDEADTPVQAKKRLDNVEELLSWLRRIYEGSPGMNGVTAAIVGATGAVGQDLLTVLAARDFPIRKLRLLASPRSAGVRIPFRGEQLEVEALAPDSFAGVEVAWFSAGSVVSREYAPKAVAALA